MLNVIFCILYVTFATLYVIFISSYVMFVILYVMPCYIICYKCYKRYSVWYLNAIFGIFYVGSNKRYVAYIQVDAPAAMLRQLLLITFGCIARERKQTVAIILPLRALDSLCLYTRSLHCRPFLTFAAT